MINKRLIALGEPKYVYGVVACQWGSMVANIAMIVRLGYQLRELSLGQATAQSMGISMGILLAVLAVRSYLKVLSTHLSHKASSKMKLTLRTLLYEQLLQLGTGYTQGFSTAEVLQISSEGVDQLESYFGSYLPQFFYCMVAPLTLFAVVAPIDVSSAVALFVCVPLIPISIMVIQKVAKKLLAKYWGLYASLGDSFLENLQGLTTLKIYQADEHYHKEMNQSAEEFRRITMKVLSMQLNSIIVMDTIAYGGAALGGILAVTALNAQRIDVMGAMIIILLAAEFFLPMRLLGSFFHIAMNGMAAAEKMFTLLDMDKPSDGTQSIPQGAVTIQAQHLSFGYNQERTVLKDISFTAPTGITALVGVSGSGKSTLAGILSGSQQTYGGTLSLSGVELSQVQAKSLHKTITYVGAQGYLFRGSVAENLRMASPNATEETLIAVLKQVQLWGFLSTQQGVDTLLQERGSNFSGGQCQRLHLARALLRDTAVYLFDEVTSNVDVESEEAILQVIFALAKSRTVILISHRLSSIVQANQILFLSQGILTEQGTHDTLLAQNGGYAQLFFKQQGQESYTKEQCP